MIDFLTNKIGDIDNQDIKLKIIGKKNFSKELNKLLTFSEKKTSKNTKKGAESHCRTRCQCGHKTNLDVLRQAGAGQSESRPYQRTANKSLGHFSSSL